MDDIVRPIEDSEVVDKGYQLTNAWQAQRRLFEQAMGLVIVKDVYAGPDGREKARTGDIPTSAVVAAAGAEFEPPRRPRPVLPQGRRPSSDAENNINDRNALIDQGLADAARGGMLPILQLRSSLIASRDVYQDLTSEAAKDIASTVQVRAAETRSAALRDTAIVLGTLLAALSSRSSCRGR